MESVCAATYREFESHSLRTHCMESYIRTTTVVQICTMVRNVMKWSKTRAKPAVNLTLSAQNKKDPAKAGSFLYLSNTRLMSCAYEPGFRGFNQLSNILPSPAILIICCWRISNGANGFANIFPRNNGLLSCRYTPSRGIKLPPHLGNPVSG